jgi:L-threonylcarbamoyladenylate synthase
MAYPTETFYGLGADVLDPRGCERIFAMKGRGAAKGLPVIIAAMDQLEPLCEPLPKAVGLLAEHFWPGPLTLVLPLVSNPGGGLAGRKSVAVRVSGLALARELARAAECLLTATSANLSGDPPADVANAVEERLGTQLDLILDGGATGGERPSTIVDLCRPEPQLVREGAVDWARILQVLRGQSLP